MVHANEGAAGRRSWTLGQWLRWQEALSPKRIQLGLERVRDVAQRLQLIPAPATTLTIAGTNGKGSSAVLAAEIYHAAGYRVGCYTSPHLLRYNERIAIDGRQLADAELCAAFRAVDAARGSRVLTYFEFGTLAALWLFRTAEVDVQVLEVGLGGRLDAVNVVDADCAIVTEIGLDHQDWLGPDRESIGREKAGVYRAGRPAICVDPDPPHSLLEIGQTTDLRCIGRDFGFEPGDSTWAWHGRVDRYRDLPVPRIAGAIQLRNAAGVLAAVEALQPLREVDRAAIEAGLAEARIRGRLEHHADLLLDVGHNAEAVEVLVEYLETQPETPRALVLGMMRDKPVEAVARRLAKVFDSVYAAGLPAPRGLSPAQLAARLLGAGMRVQACVDVESALAAARRDTAGKHGTIVVCGSFKTVVAALEHGNSSS